MDISSLRERKFTDTISVSELNGYIKKLFESDRALSAISIRGEISNFTNHRSGHLYFSLKDVDAQVRAVMFRSSAERLKFKPENGMKVVVRGSVALYAKDGTYQIYVTTMEPDGIGALYLAYEQLKSKLTEEGLFDDWHKKLIPEFPSRIGIITSPTGAAVRDIINVATRRHPGIKLYLYPSLVQGDGAEENLIRALDYFDKSKLVDVIIIGRGGGSIEDLWAFNGERLARRIYEAETPIISAVGHETDFTICDFVADLRAPTPSAGAELAVPDAKSYLRHVDDLFDRATFALEKSVDRKREQLDRLLVDTVISSPIEFIEPRRVAVTEALEAIGRAMQDTIKAKRHSLTLNSEKANALSPLATLSRGYAIAERNGKPLRSVKELEMGELISVRLADGSVSTVVTELKNNRRK